jgi:hypothetical protein
MENLNSQIVIYKAHDGQTKIDVRFDGDVEFLGIWENIYNSSFNYGRFAIIKGKIGLSKALKRVIGETLTNASGRSILKALKPPALTPLGHGGF